MAGRPAKVWTGTEWVPLAVAQAVDTDGITAASAAAIYLRQDTASATYISDSIVDAKGDLIVATAADTVDKVTVGANGQMLMADSSATAGLRYVDPPTNRNLLINGSFAVAQRSTSLAGISTGVSLYRTADRWNTGVSMGTFTQSVEADAPAGSGLAKSLKMLCTTAQASPAANNFIFVAQLIEGQNVQHVRKGSASAQQLSLSFWVKSNVTSTFVVEILDADNNRHVSLPYSVTAADTWERKTLLIPADTTGALDNDNAGSLNTTFWLGAGSDRTSGTLASTWASRTSASIYAGGSNLAAATNNYWQITGVQLETGPVATPFEFEPYEATLRKCQRYYQKFGLSQGEPLGALGFSATTSVGFILLPGKGTMRTTPTAVETSNARTSDYASNFSGGTWAVATASTADSLALKYTHGSAALTAYRPLYVDSSSGAGWIAVTAEL